MAARKRFSLAFGGSDSGKQRSPSIDSSGDASIGSSGPAPPLKSGGGRRFSLTFGRSKAAYVPSPPTVEENGSQSGDIANEMETHRPSFTSSVDKAKDSSIAAPKASRRTSLGLSFGKANSAPVQEQQPLPADERRRVARLSFSGQLMKQSMSASSLATTANSDEGSQKQGAIPEGERLWSIDREKLRKLLRGDVAELESFELPKPSLHIFVSSGGKDSDAERIILMDKIYPVLKEKGAKEGIDVLFIDLVGTDSSSAVRDNPVDGDIWMRSVEEIQRCYEQSGGIFFLSLQGYKSGFSPLPKYLDKNLYEERLQSEEISKKANAGELLAVAKEWYRLDENHVPPRYVLKQPIGLNYNKKRLEEVRVMLIEVFNEINREEYLVLGRSIGEWEAILAANLDGAGCRWITRDYQLQYPIVNTPPPAPVASSAASSLFPTVADDDENQGDPVPPESSPPLQTTLAANIEKPKPCQAILEAIAVDSNVKDIHHKLSTTYLPKENIHKVSFAIPVNDNTTHGHSANKSLSPVSFNSEEYKQYLQQWEDTTFTILEKELQGVIQMRNTWISDSLQSDQVSGKVGLPSTTSVCDGLTGKDLDEMIHHITMTSNQSKVCYDRDNVLQEVLDILNAKRTISSGTTNGTTTVPPITCCIYGEEGVGKTTLIAKLATLFDNTNPSLSVTNKKKGIQPLTPSTDLTNLPVITRYCGTSYESNNSYLLLQSICLQIMWLYNDKELLTFIKDKSNYTCKQLIETFYDLLEHYPLILLFDNIDCLTTTDEMSLFIVLQGLTDTMLNERSRIILTYSTGSNVDSDIVKLLKITPTAVVSNAKGNKSTSTAATTIIPHIHLTAFDGQATSGGLLGSSSSSSVKGKGTPSQRVVSKLLAKKGRKLTDSQWNTVMKALASDGRPLYLQLVAERAMELSSSDDLEKRSDELFPPLNDMIVSIIQQLEVKHGQKLVQFALGLLGLSRFGKYIVLIVYRSMC